ncbi:hypothetical protein QR680_005904 [Steinernema hermaphroditum]|uniref:Peptidase S1 domain-containing protein n=1 Tax=Steinernema hermaphroditum TaxID=289476 RepID=A0AA39HW32_9BILA|nr:hypothetical protein QR680_005904 [Steinernema hermaphroditum]
MSVFASFRWFVLLHLSFAYECGRSFEFWELRWSRFISNEGNSTVAPAFPWFAALQTAGSADAHPFCGGSVVGRRWILTAASCLQSVSDFEIVLGLKYMNRFNPLRTTYRVRRTVVHKDYGMMGSDIALIETTQPIGYNRHVQPVCLPKDDSNLKTGLPANTTGFGVKESHEAADHLLMINTTFRDVSDCEGIDSNGVFNASHGSNSILCLGTTDKELCHGDSGAPLTRKQLFDISWQYGIASMSPKCGDDIGHPSVYTRIAFFCDWIDESTKGEVYCQEGNSEDDSDV